MPDISGKEKLYILGLITKLRNNAFITVAKREGISMDKLFQYTEYAKKHFPGSYKLIEEKLEASKNWKARKNRVIQAKLFAQGSDMDSIARKFDVTRETVYNNIKQVKRLGFPVLQESVMTMIEAQNGQNRITQMKMRLFYCENRYSWDN